jgi:hypothetical protein
MIGTPPTARSRALLLALLTFAAANVWAAQQPAPETPAAPEDRRQVIDAIQDLEKSLGFQPTGNFQARSDTVAAYYRCYFTGKLELPASYDDLQLKQSKKPECPVDSSQYDVFFYPIEAVASGKNPVTTSLQNSSLERMIMVVPHEDFHEHKQVRKSPASIMEAASTLIGFLTAGRFAREKFGASSPVAQNLSREPELFLQKARIVNRYHAEISSLYAAARSGEIAKPEALAKKQTLFDRLQAECRTITPEPASFSSCPGAANNAGLAFDFTYTKHYPLLYEVFLSQHSDVRHTIDAVKQALAAGPASEDEAVKAFQDLIERSESAASP